MYLGMSLGLISYLLGFGLIIALGKLGLEYALKGFSANHLPSSLLYYGINSQRRLPAQALFMADWWANGTAYLAALVGLTGFCRYIVKNRSQVYRLVAPLKG